MKVTTVFSGMSVDDIGAAKDFYTKTLAFDLVDENMGLRFRMPFGGMLFLYEKEDYQPASYTALNLVVDDIDEAVDELRERGARFEFYKNLFKDAPQQDEKGIMRSPDPLQYGPSIAWFKDPAGNTIAVIQDISASQAA